MNTKQAAAYTSLQKQKMTGGNNFTGNAVMTPAGAQETQEGFDALGRPIVQADMTQADKYAQQNAKLRGAQTQAHSLWSNAAMGFGPNTAQRELDLGLNNVVQQQAGASAPGLAALAAARQGSGMNNQLVAQAGAGRNAEQQMYNQQMGAVTGAQMQDENTLGALGNQRAESQAQLGLASNNQNLNMALGKLGIGASYNDQAANNRLAGLYDAWNQQRADSDYINRQNADLAAFHNGIIGTVANVPGQWLGMGANSMIPKEDTVTGYNPKYGF